MARSGTATQDRRALVTTQASGGVPQEALAAVAREVERRLDLVEQLGVDRDRMRTVMLTTFTRTPGLWTCDPVSIARAMTEAAELKLEPTGLMGGAYLVPRKGQATLLVGYRGLIILARRSGEVQRVEARVVRAKDEFHYSYGLDQELVHVPSEDADPGPYTHAYAAIFYRDGSRQFDVMTYADIDAIRKRSSSPDSGPWVTDWAEMAKKTPLRRLMKMAPLTLEAAAALDRIDPEVAHDPAAAPRVDRQATLRRQLQARLDETYSEPPPSTPPGEQAGGQPSTAAEQPPAPRAAGAAGDGDPGPQPEGVPTLAAGAGPSSAPAQACGVRHEGLGVGPCVLPAGHPENEHEEAGGVRWSQPREVAR